MKAFAVAMVLATALVITAGSVRGAVDPPVPPVLRSDFKLPPPERPGTRASPDAPSSTQTSEFMAGKIVYSVVFVESSGGAGSCSPADPSSESWTGPRRATVLDEIADGLAFWTSRKKKPSPLSFVLDDRGVQPTSCEPITRPTTDEDLWVADVLTAMGFQATPRNYFDVARAFAHSRRAALAADWAFTIFVVDSLNDPDGSFADGFSAYAYLNGPLQVLTWDNDGWGIDNLNLVALHETGHIFGALDEYDASGCTTEDSWGYLNVENASCNNGGITTDISVMGEASELVNPNADVSTSARGAIGWRNPKGKIVDVIRTATASLTPFSPDPTSDTTPTYSAVAGNEPFPPGGCNTLGGDCLRIPLPVTVSKAKKPKWKLDAGKLTTQGVAANDGAFDEETDAYMFTPTSPVPPGTHTFTTIALNDFGHKSSPKSDTLTISP